MSLDIEWAMRDRIAIVDLGVQAARARPDYLLLVNEQRSAWAGFEEAAKLGVKVLLLNRAASDAMGLGAIRDGRMLMAVGGHFLAGGFSRSSTAAMSAPM